MMKPSDGYIEYIVNPKSGATSRKLMVSRFRQYLEKKGFDVRFKYTESLGHARELATNAAIDYNCAMVIVAGGDGTVREVAGGLEGTDKPMIIAPCGTENLLASELGFDEKAETLIKVFEEGYIRPFDLGKANGRCFTSIAGFGFDGDVVKRVTELRQGHIHHLDYFYPIWRTFWDYKFPPIKVVCDGEQIFDGQGLVFVGNISRYAVGLQILHYADYGDGLLDVCIYKCAGQAHLIKHSLMTALKRQANRPDVIYKQAKNIKVSSTVPMTSELDGDPGPGLPLEISVLPQAIKVMVPKGAKPAGIRTRLIRMLG
jgi:YegS/Rv2252/BmrU family lipid kinase